LNINLFSDKGLVKRIKWSKILIEDLDESIVNYFNKDEFSIREIKSHREVLDFDLSRYCELEIIKSRWLTLKGNLTDHDLIINKINSLFEPNFKVNDIWFDDIGYLIFKISLTAVKKGQLHSFLELGILIEVLNESEIISNEVKKNCLLYDRKNELQLRVGDSLYFYLSKNK